MKKNFTLVTALIALVLPSAFAGFVSKGDKSIITFESLSKIDTSGVTKDGLKYIVAEDITIAPTDTLRILNNDSILLGNTVNVTVNGYADFVPTDTAYVGRTDADAKPKGFTITGADAVGVVKNMSVEYAEIRYGATTGLTVNNCTFQNANGKMSSAGVIVFSGNNTGNVITNCKFINNTTPAIGGGANVMNGVIFSHNYLSDNNSSNSNRPQINLTVGGNADVVVTNNVVKGAKRNKVGGIGVSNMLGLKGTNVVVVENNDVSDCRYGVTLIGSMKGSIKNNNLISNKYEDNPANGGSAISIYDSSKTQETMVTGNRIEDSLWGITVIGGKDVNIGKVADPKATDYNPGLNVFKDNGNGGVLYDLYNNTTNTVYAQGNTWNVTTQDSISIEQVVFHKADNPSLGEVIFMPAHDGSSVKNTSIDSAKAFFADNTVVAPEISNIEVYSISGQSVADARQVTELKLNLNPGMYIARISAGSNNQSIKFIVR